MKYRPSPEVISKRLDNASILVDLRTSRIFELNETGTRVWELLCQEMDEGELVRRLIDDFEIEENRAAREVRGLITQLRTEGLLEP